jgi:hypothetical protein
MTKKYDYTHSEMDMPGYGSDKEADIDDTKVNKAKYRRASMAARQFARRKGISPIKATKALSETTRAAVDTEYGMGSQGQRNVSRGLTALASRLQDGDRSGRFASTARGTYNTMKGEIIGEFGQRLGTELGYGNKPVLRPKLPKNSVKAGKTVANIIKTIR